MTDRVPTKKLRVRLGTIADKAVLVLQVLMVPQDGVMHGYAICDERWQDATVEDLSTIAGLSLGKLLSDGVQR